MQPPMTAQISKLHAIHILNVRAFDGDTSMGFCSTSNPYLAAFSFREENMAPPYKIWVP